LSVSYVKLWKLLLDRKLKRTNLISMAGISSNILAKLGKNDYVSMESLEKICKALDCNIGDIVEFSFEEYELKE
jgi:putative transcriptional regulator